MKVLIQSAPLQFSSILAGKTRTTLHPEDNNVDKLWKKGAKYLNSMELGYAAKAAAICERSSRSGLVSAGVRHCIRGQRRF